MPDRTYRVAYWCPAVVEPAVDRLVRSRLAAVDLVEAAPDLRPPDPAWQALYALDNDRPTGDLVLAGAIRRHNNTVLADLFAEVDALVTAATPAPAHGYGDYDANLAAGDLCWGFNVTGHPAVAVPAGLVDGLPVGLQVVAAHGRDDLALAVAARLRAFLPRPPIHA